MSANPSSVSPSIRGPQPSMLVSSNHNRFTSLGFDLDSTDLALHQLENEEIEQGEQVEQNANKGRNLAISSNTPGQVMTKTKESNDLARVIEVIGRIISAATGIGIIVLGSLALLAAFSNPIGWAVIGSALIIGVLAGGLLPGAIRGDATDMAKGVFINIACVIALPVVLVYWASNGGENEQATIEHKPPSSLQAEIGRVPVREAIKEPEAQPPASQRKREPDLKEAQEDSSKLLETVFDEGAIYIIDEMSLVPKEKRPEVVYYTKLLAEGLSGHQKAEMIEDINKIINGKENYQQIFERAEELLKGRPPVQKLEILRAIAEIPAEGFEEILNQVMPDIANILSLGPDISIQKLMLNIINRGIADHYAKRLTDGLEKAFEKRSVAIAVRNILEKPNFKDIINQAALQVAGKSAQERIAILNAIAEGRNEARGPAAAAAP